MHQVRHHPQNSAKYMAIFPSVGNYDQQFYLSV